MSDRIFTFGLRSRLTGLDRALLIVSMAASAAYLATVAWQPYPGSIVIKGLSVGPLAVLAFRLLIGRDGVVLGVSLLFSTLGDIFLGLRGPGMFLYGLLSFLVAHLFYITLFMRHWPRPLRTSLGQKMIAALVVMASIALVVWLWPGMGDLRVPVLVYVGAITFMCVAAALAFFPTSWVVIGALLFLLSDSLIAIGRFKEPVPLAGYAIWATYYVGQFLIALGFIRAHQRRGMR